MIGATLTVIVFGVGSRLLPPLAVFPLSCTWNVNVVYVAPFAFAAAKNVSAGMLPAVQQQMADFSGKIA